ncbi:D-alanyl-D-alanine carboxypeptidase [Bacillus luteolus]|uniref:serine-type D-Ala-D-Ala carboxypeptidase n=1 Tax=Litchfieldia luteola TaxID=682179 RepID=A0ABR9QEA5_9BACI|nr:D-alanyl-D-alanine carboxypeptidase family protein [Cytobacillus luteolus]MBE4906825.1 D-alanyl-D-alanine carboxypeptidase [Cytobacillus luteolus]MBP1940521.1 D-alanyl-D-alanine carboxypeptidase [Cytobacillus luteolus]
MKRSKYITILTVFLLLITLLPTKSHAIAAKGAILMEQHSGRVLYEKNAHAPLRIASITKIMTAILAIESGKLDDTVKVSNKAIHTEGSSLYLQPNEKMKLIDLTYGLMLRSGNDAAVAIAEHVGGSLDEFVDMMNKKAKEIGMKNTVFANPHGLDDHENHYSSAYDMALLTRYAMKNETYAKISGTKDYRPSSGEIARSWHNKNRLLTQFYEYCTGGKTGYTKRAKRTLVTTASKDDLDLIAVTINDGNDWNDHMALYNRAFEQYELVEIVKKDEQAQINDQYYKGNISTKDRFVYPMTAKEKEEVSLSIKLLHPKKVKKGHDLEDPVGKISVYIKDKSIGHVNLYLTDIPDDLEKGFWEKLKDKFK